MFVWLLQLFGFLLDVKPAYLYEEVLKVERRAIDSKTHQRKKRRTRTKTKTKTKTRARTQGDKKTDEKPSSDISSVIVVQKQ